MTLNKSAVLDSVSQQAIPPVFKTLPSPHHQLQVCVIVPARNEAEHLHDTLHALYYQTGNGEIPLDKSLYEVLLLVNNCTDHTAAVAYQFQQQHPNFHLHIEEICLKGNKANIGTVRRLLMDEACKRLKLTGRHNGIIASTDGDTVVDEKWIHHIMQEIAEGADAVGGRILTHASKHPVRLWHLRDVMYRTLLAKAEALIDPCTYDPWPRHFQYFGANLAVTCNTYEQAGRLPEVPFLEDNAFYEALTMIDARIRKSCKVKVYTSDRQQGRVAVGFSEQLSKWNSDLEKRKLQQVPAISAQLNEWKLRQNLRQIHQQFLQNGLLVSDEIQMLAKQYHLPENWLTEQLTSQVYFGKLWKCIQQQLHAKKLSFTLISITEAIAELRQFINNYKY